MGPKWAASPHTLYEKGPGIDFRGHSKEMGRRPTLPPGLPGSTIGAGGLNFSVRNGKRCDPSAIATPTMLTIELRRGQEAEDI